MSKAYTVKVSDTWTLGTEPYFVSIDEIKATGQTADGEPLYELHGGRLYQPARYTDAVATKSEALAKVATILFDRINKIKSMQEEYTRRSIEQARVEQAEEAAV